MKLNVRLLNILLFQFLRLWRFTVFLSFMSLLTECLLERERHQLGLWEVITLFSEAKTIYRLIKKVRAMALIFIFVTVCLCDIIPSFTQDGGLLFAGLLTTMMQKWYKTNFCVTLSRLLLLLPLYNPCHLLLPRFSFSLHLYLFTPPSFSLLFISLPIHPALSSFTHFRLQTSAQCCRWVTESHLIKF